VIKHLVDQAFKAGKMMIRTHLKADILHFIKLAQLVQAEGYSLIWIKHRGCVGAHRKEVTQCGSTKPLEG